MGHRGACGRPPRSGAEADLPVYIHFGQLWGLPEAGANGVDPDSILPQGRAS
jgi:hypothetical protein